MYASSIVTIHTQISQLTSFIDYFSTTLAQFHGSNGMTYVHGDYNINLLLINENIHCSSSFFLSWKIFIIMINRQKHYTKYLHDKLETKDIRCI